MAANCRAPVSPARRRKGGCNPPALGSRIGGRYRLSDIAREKFVLEYYRKEHPELGASDPQIPWDISGEPDELLPIMQSDIVLKKGGRVFVVDAKYYTHTTQERFGKRSLHSANLYQIFTYVKNMQASLPASSSPVMGMLLYAKTDNDPAVDSRYVLGGNPIMARTLDLNQEFSTIRAQLDAIATLLDTSE